MITEDYVSFETAKLLKENGFEYNPDESYWVIDADNKMYWISAIGAYVYVDNPTDSFQRPINSYRLVTQAMAMKWLREVHNLNICFRPVKLPRKIEWRAYIFNKDCEALPINAICGKTYEEACEAAIKYCLVEYGK